MTRAWELGSFADQEITHLAPMPGGDVIVVGDMYGTMDFGEGVVAEAYFGDDIVIARIAPDGTPQWAEMATGGGMIPRGLAVGSDGSIAVVGWFQTELVLGRGEPTEEAVRDPVYTINGFIAVLEASGMPRWIRAVSGDLGMEELVKVAFSPDGSIWVAGSFEHETATVSAGQPDAVVISGGDASSSTDDTFVAHYDANGALLGVVTLLGDGPQSSLALAARPAGGVDWAVAGAGGTVADSAGKGLILDSERSVVRVGASGLVEAALPVEGLHSFRHLAYVDGDLVALLTGPRPLTVSDWGLGSATAVADGYLFNGLVTWQGGTAPVELEAVQWYSGNGTFTAGIGGTAVGDFMSGDMELLPDTFAIELDTEVPYTESSGRPGAVAWPPDRALACAVDLEPDGESWAGLTSEIAVAVDEAGGLWLGGTFREMSLTVEEPPGAVLDAIPAEDDQGFLVRWQLWPGAPGPTLP